MSIYDEIAQERKRQDEMWGGPAHDDLHDYYDWQKFREKYEGEIVNAGVQATMEKIRLSRREALIKIAALAVAQIESIDRSA